MVVTLRIQASKCLNCENVIIPPRDLCPYCGPGSSKMAQIEVSNTGQVLTFTSLEMPPEGFDPPVVLALVQLDDGGIILCLGDKGEVEKTTIGSSVSISQDADERFHYKIST
jgi:uncharacterized OB-fold protein